MRVTFIFCLLFIMLSTFAGAIVKKAEPHLKINKFVLAKEVSDRSPVGIKEMFAISDARVMAFAELDVAGEEFIKFVWKRDGNHYFEYKASVEDSSSWRTYSSVSALAGNWTVGIYGSDGKLLQEISFKVTRDGNIHSQTGDKVNSLNAEPNSLSEVLKSMEGNATKKQP